MLKSRNQEKWTREKNDVEMVVMVGAAAGGGGGDGVVTVYSLRQTVRQTDRLAEGTRKV